MTQYPGTTVLPRRYVRYHFVIEMGYVVIRLQWTRVFDNGLADLPPRRAVLVSEKRLDQLAPVSVGTLDARDGRCFARLERYGPEFVYKESQPPGRVLFRGLADTLVKLGTPVG